MRTPSSRRGRSERDGHPAGSVQVPAEKRRRNGGSERSSEVVRQTLESYAKRGIFRAYGGQPSEGEQSRFSFRWHMDATFHVVYGPSRRELLFSDVLPKIASRSRMYRALRVYVEAHTSPTLPEHRRIDPRKARVTVTNRDGMISFIVALKDAHLEYGVRKAVNLIHELFVDFLRNPLYFDYLVEHFQLDPDM